MKNQTTNPGNEGNRMDDYFRQALQNYQPDPPARIWNQISRKLLIRELVKFNFTNLPKIIPVTAMVGATILASWFLFFNGDPENSSVSHAGVVHAPSAPSPTTSISGTHESVPDMSPAATAGQLIASVSANTKKYPEVTASSSLAAVTNHPSSTAPGTFKGSGAVSASSAPAPAPAVSAFFALSTLEPSIDLKKNDLPAFVPMDMTSLPKPSSPSFFSAGMDLSPEYTSYKSDVPSANEISYWAKLGLTYHFSRFTLSSGVSYGYSTTESKYRVSYRSNDSIGYFTSIVSFYIDPVNPDEVIFNTKTTTVYDSIDHLRDDRARTRYSYLRIPLLLGVDLLQTQRLTVNFHAGPAFTFMINEKKAAPYIDYPNSRIIRIDSEEPPRIKTGWEIWTGLHIDYQLTDNFAVYTEPTFKYFLKPQYKHEVTQDAQPWSVGLGIGIQYNFGKK